MITDHKPLLRIFNDKRLDDVDNGRLLKLKEKTMPYRFTIHHIDGKRNVADVFSRYPVSHPDNDDINLAASMEIACVEHINEINAVFAVTNDAVKQAGDEDEQYQKVISRITRPHG